MLLSETGMLTKGIKLEPDARGEEIIYKPESKPPGAALQGLAKVDCVAV